MQGNKNGRTDWTSCGPIRFGHYHTAYVMLGMPSAKQGIVEKKSCILKNYIILSTEKYYAQIYLKSIVKNLIYNYLMVWYGNFLFDMMK